MYDILIEQLEIRDKSNTLLTKVGSLEAVLSELKNISQEEIVINTIYAEIGAVSESDILLAAHADALVVQFNVPILPKAQKMAVSETVKIIKDRIIYSVIDGVRESLSSLLDPVYKDENLGEANIIQVFHMSGKSSASIAGCLVKSGVVRRGEWARVVRGKDTLFEGKIKSIRHLKDDVKEKSTGSECGIILEGYTDFQIDDLIQCFSRTEIERSI